MPQGAATFIWLTENLSGLEDCWKTAGRLPVELYQNVSPALTASLASLHLLPVEFYKNVHSVIIFFDSQQEENLSREGWA